MAVACNGSANRVQRLQKSIYHPRKAPVSEVIYVIRYRDAVCLENVKRHAWFHNQALQGYNITHRRSNVNDGVKGTDQLRLHLITSRLT